MRTFWKIACAGACAACTLGCVEESRVIIAPRALPAYPQSMDGRGGAREREGVRLPAA